MASDINYKELYEATEQQRKGWAELAINGKALIEKLEKHNKELKSLLDEAIETGLELANQLQKKIK